MNERRAAFRWMALSERHAKTHAEGALQPTVHWEAAPMRAARHVRTMEGRSANRQSFAFRSHFERSRSVPRIASTTMKPKVSIASTFSAPPARRFLRGLAVAWLATSSVAAQAPPVLSGKVSEVTVYQ